MKKAPSGDDAETWYTKPTASFMKISARGSIREAYWLKKSKRTESESEKETGEEQWIIPY